MYEISTKEILEAQNSSEQAMTKILENNSNLIWSIVKRFQNRGYLKEELYQIGCIGLIKAVKKFDSSFEVKISTYAVPYIIGEIKRFIRDDGPIKLSRSLKELLLKVKEIQNEYSKLGKDITITEIAKKLNVDEDDINLAIEADKPIQSIDVEIYNEDNGETKISRIGGKIDETNVIINKICLNQLIQELNENEKKIILLRYYKEKTQAEVAKMLGISQVQVSRIEKKVLQEMKRKIN